MTAAADPAADSGADPAANPFADPGADPATDPVAGIIGLGLMGGSLARDLHAAGWRVLGDDRDPDTLASALSSGVLDGPLRPDDIPSLHLLILALPVRSATKRIRSIAGSVDAESDLVITDVGSTKRSVAAAAVAAGLATRFVGSHPMAGSHESGWRAGRAGLYGGRPVWVCPTTSSRPDAVAAVESLWRSLGARPRRSDPDAHDRLLARASHLPQLAATALATVLARHGVAPDDLGPGGRDATRLAASDPDMWTDIALDNVDEVAPALDDLARELADLARAIRDGDAHSVHARMAAGRAWTAQP